MAVRYAQVNVNVSIVLSNGCLVRRCPYTRDYVTMAMYYYLGNPWHVTKLVVGSFPVEKSARKVAWRV